MKNLQLREKDRHIFNLIVEEYLSTGKPVSSDVVSSRSRLPVSSATVRNIMAKLEKQNYLYKPHSSSGRIPTDLGLRLYVNHLYNQAIAPGDYIELPAEEFSLEKGDLDSLLRQVSQTLSKYSDNLGFVISPTISRMNFNHIRMIRIAEEKVMIILVTTFNLVLTEIIEPTVSITQTELDRACRFIEENFRGKRLVDVRDYLLKEFPKYRMRVEVILQKLTDLLKAYSVHQESEQKIILQGAAKLLEKPELFDMKRLQSLFQKFEERAKLAKLLSDFISLDRVKVIIGSELELPDISDCSLILSHYGYERQILGSLGIIGPKRIPYRKVIPLVEYVARKLSQTISVH
ncbi:MAG: heat-inducible transcriptional repressor HrcA [Acidobacteriota bacterium]